MEKKLYTPLEIQAAFVAWATLSEQLFPNYEAWLKGRRELWLTYCDARDGKARGTARAIEEAIVEEPQLTLL